MRFPLSLLASTPLTEMDKKKQALDLQELALGGDSWARTNGRASLGRLTQAPLALAPHDLNDVL